MGGMGALASYFVGKAAFLFLDGHLQVCLSASGDSFLFSFWVTVIDGK